MDSGAWWATVHGVPQRVRHILAIKQPTTKTLKTKQTKKKIFSNSGDDRIVPQKEIISMPQLRLGRKEWQSVFTLHSDGSIYAA